MPTQEIPIITKETQKIVLKTMCEYPTYDAEELTLFLNNTGKKISQEEVIQVLHSISPGKNWHRATKEDVQKEMLEYVWTLEAQILFLLPTKQKETTIAEFNQTRLQSKQTKVQKDVVRHLQTLLMVDNKNLSKFRKFEKELSLQNDVEENVQALWLIRIILATINIDLIHGINDLSALLSSQFKEKFPILSEKVGKTIQRICERFTEKYFPKNSSEAKLRELISSYQSIYRSYKKGIDGELATQGEIADQNKIVQNASEQLKEIQEILSQSEEGGGILSKLFRSNIKGKGGIIAKVDEVISLLNQINELNTKGNKAVGEKLLLIQKLQSDYESVVLVKNQLENDLYNLNEKIKELEEKNASMEKDLHDKTESMERAHEKIAHLQQKVDGLPLLETKIETLREELSTAKDISLRLYQRLTKLKADLLKQNSEKPKTHKINNGQKPNVIINHIKEQNQESSQVVPNTESSVKAS